MRRTALFIIIVLATVLILLTGCPAGVEKTPVKARTITFEVTAAFVPLEGVRISLYSDETLLDQVGDSVVTDEDGKATEQLVDGSYWFAAEKEDYPRFEDGLLVEGEDLVVTIDMLPFTVPHPGYTVTFEATGSAHLGSLRIYVFDSEGELAEELFTEDDGIASTNLQNGEYSFETSKIDYLDRSGVFSVDGQDRTILIHLLLKYTTDIRGTWDLENCLEENWRLDIDKQIDYDFTGRAWSENNTFDWVSFGGTVRFATVEFTIVWQDLRGNVWTDNYEGVVSNGMMEGTLVGDNLPYCLWYAILSDLTTTSD